MQSREQSGREDPAEIVPQAAVMIPRGCLVLSLLLAVGMEKRFGGHLGGLILRIG